MSLSSRWLRPLLAVLGGTMMVLGERVLAAYQSVGPYATGAGVALLVLLFALVLRQRRGAARAAFLLEAVPAALFLISAAFYLGGMIALESSAANSQWHGLMTWGWALTLLLGLFPFLLVEISLWSQGYPDAPEPTRLMRALQAGLFLGLTLCLVVTLNFIFSRLDWQWDLAYFKPARPSPATLELAEGLQEPVDVALFFPKHNLIHSQVRSYIDFLTTQGMKLEVKSYDADLNPVEARDYKVRQNGAVVLRKDKARKEINVGQNRKRARRKVREFDSLFFAALLEVAQKKRMAYLTVGHGERNVQRTQKENPRTGVGELRALLTERNFTVRKLGLAQELGRHVPNDADLVIILAPEEPFQAGEIKALKTYLDSGGRLMVFMDPETQKFARGRKNASLPLMRFLADYGIDFVPVVQANDRIFLSRTYSKADHGFIMTVAYQNHDAVKSLRSNANRNPLLFLGAGTLKAGKPPAGLQLRPTVKAMAGTWGDRNGNFEFDEGKEIRSQSILSLALARKMAGRKAGKPEGTRMLVFSDADVAMDYLLRNRSNRLLLAESIRWLTAQALPSGLTDKGKDVRIVQAKGDEWFWYYLPLFIGPLVVMGLGMWLSGRIGFKRSA